jgi:GTPase involved in cell partitioning and DNA repair
LASLPLPPEFALITEGNNMSKFSDTLVTSTVLSVREKIKLTLDEESFNDFEQALQDNSISSKAIYRALQNLGVETSANSIQRMRKQ